MNKKLVGIFVCTLLIATVVISVSGAGNVAKNQNHEKDIPSYNDMKKPDPPVMYPILGPPKVRRFELNSWNFMAKDPDGDKFTFYINWGDGKDSRWPGVSDVAAHVPHIYGISSWGKVICNISAFAIDKHGEKGDPVYYEVGFIPKTRVRSDVISNNIPLVRFGSHRLALLKSVF